MPDYHYLIVGGGMAAYAAIRGIRAVDSERSIGLISSESHAPYKKPPLSKGLWLGKPIEKIWYRMEDLKVSQHLGRSVKVVNIADKALIDDRMDRYRYQKLLLATGGNTVKLPFGEDEIIYFRDLDDYYELRAVTERKRKIAVIGGGFVGSEIAAALAMNGKQVVMLFPEAGIGGALFPDDLSQFLNNYYRTKGIDVLPRRFIVGLERQNETLLLKTQDADGHALSDIEADAIVAGIGIKPNVGLAEQAGLTVGNGIVVDELLRSENPNVYAAGDVANFYNPALGVRMRAEHEDNALTMGECAGRNMAGEANTYGHLPYFYSDLFDLGYEAIGKTDSRLETVADWVEPYQKGVIYYLQQKRVRGVLLWNVWNRVDGARALIAEAGPFERTDLIGKLTS